MSDKRPRHEIPQELLDALHINTETGEIRWALTVCSRAKQGDVAGTLREDGYRKVCFRGVIFYAHRLVWAKVHGRKSVPTQLDHVAGMDNGIANLRAATQSQNNMNVPPRRTYAGKPCASKMKGVSRFKCRGWERWVARIGIKGKTKTIGYFLTEEEASRAYQHAAIAHYGEFATP